MHFAAVEASSGWDGPRDPVVLAAMVAGFPERCSECR